MNQAATRPQLDFELCVRDGVPLDSERHGKQMELFARLIEAEKSARGEKDYYVGTDMFVYYDVQQARAIAQNPKTKKHFKGPDIFFVDNVPDRQREYWVVWEEDNRYPDVVVELLSPSTAEYDKRDKKTFYETTLRTPEYFYYRPGTDELAGFRLKTSGYQKIAPKPFGLWSRKLELYVGLWDGVYRGRDGQWLRLFDRDGQLVLTPEEAAQQRAEAAEAEIARLKALLHQR